MSPVVIPSNKMITTWGNDPSQPILAPQIWSPGTSQGVQGDSSQQRPSLFCHAWCEVLPVSCARDALPFCPADPEASAASEKIVRGRSHRLFWYCKSCFILPQAYSWFVCSTTHWYYTITLNKMKLCQSTVYSMLWIFCYYTRLYYFIWTFILQHSIDCCCGRNCIMHYNATCICYLMSCNVMLCYAARSCTMLENDAIPYHVISYRRCACRSSSFIFFLSLPMKYLKRWWLEDKVHII